MTCIKRYIFLFGNIQIIVLENGKVVEHGPHEVLLANAGRYAQLWGQQNNTIDAIDSATKLGT
jgi:ATP-binding cassette, subfamily B (MDR/TAP), member 7